MARVLAVLTAATILAGCAANQALAPPVAPVAEAAPVARAEPPAPKPQYGSFGFDKDLHADLIDQWLPADAKNSDQRFYLGWAQIRRRNCREANLRERLLTDPHSPSKQRVAIIRNMDSRYPAFNVQPGRKLYLPPADRVRIW